MLVLGSALPFDAMVDSAGRARADETGDGWDGVGDHTVRSLRARGSGTGC